ncbi:hypothetical protein IEQ11_19075 [Lysobacter capsici]|uniref:DUF6966 domain-containing protein n=1 Tax=Lysobacter capsici TaxID=435897 RepID=UPI00044B8565|nr:hypothetical protein [Lysobacter capsici]ALN87409.1 hypothetical protein LC55x_4158 [Lysobacter capsici]UOF13822.1 hypothetical protein IEQ11_19075 [Lysobacter capsici]
MTELREIQALLDRMVDLLNLAAQPDWAGALERHREAIGTAPDITKARILAMYGGMGSLNDVVLYKNGQPLSRENNEFDELRIRLHELCRAT